jgi:hypothetical protein
MKKIQRAIIPAAVLCSMLGCTTVRDPDTKKVSIGIFTGIEVIDLPVSEEIAANERSIYLQDGTHRLTFDQWVNHRKPTDPKPNPSAMADWKLVALAGTNPLIHTSNYNTQLTNLMSNSEIIYSPLRGDKRTYYDNFVVALCPPTIDNKITLSGACLVAKRIRVFNPAEEQYTKAVWNSKINIEDILRMSKKKTESQNVFTESPDAYNRIVSAYKKQQERLAELRKFEADRDRENLRLQRLREEENRKAMRTQGKAQLQNSESGYLLSCSAKIQSEYFACDSTPSIWTKKELMGFGWTLNSEQIQGDQKFLTIRKK